jgi:hypothetical protein
VLDQSAEVALRHPAVEKVGFTLQHGGLDAPALRSQVSSGRQALDAGIVINRDARDDFIQIHLQILFSDWVVGVEILRALLGSAAFPGELEGRPRSMVELFTLKLSLAVYYPPNSPAYNASLRLLRRRRLLSSRQNF